MIIRLLILLMMVGPSNKLESFSFEEFKVYPSKHNFPEIYSYIRTHIEGNYVDHPGDKGGETYGGIARKIHPLWYGWRHVDAAKPLESHDRVEAAETWVLAFYLDIWVAEGFENIEDKNLALNLFDFRIHSSPKTVTKKVNIVLLEMGCDPITMKGEWIDGRFNSLDPTEFSLRLKIQRLLLFNYLVNKDKSQLVFYKGWTDRLSNI